MDSLRERNFVIDIRGIRKLRDENIYNFIAKNLKLTPMDVAAIQIDRIEGKVFVEMKEEDAVHAVVEEFDNKYAINSNGTTHRIRLYVEDGGTDVKLHHLPPNMPEEWIFEYLETYGDIISIKHEMCQSQFFASIPSGIRVVRIRMKCHIPSFVNIKGYSSHVTYTNQIQTCRHCNQEVHFGVSCSENRAKLSSQNKSSLYSRVLAQSRDPDKSEDQPESELQSTVQTITTATHQTPSQPQAVQQLYKRPAAPLEAELREKTVKTSNTDTEIATVPTAEKAKSTKGNETVSTLSDRPRITPVNNRSSSLSRKPEKTMEISDDEQPTPDSMRARRPAKNKHDGK